MPSIAALSSTPTRNASGWRVEQPSRGLPRAGPQLEHAPSARPGRRDQLRLQARVVRNVGPDHVRVGVGVEVVLAPQSRPELVVADRADADHLPRAVLLVAPQVDDRRRRARQLAAVDHEIDRATEQLRHVVEPPRIGPAGAVGARLQHRPAHARELRHRRAPATRASTGRRRTRAGSARPGWAAARSPRRAASRDNASRVRSPSSGSAVKRKRQVEEHHRRRLARSAAASGCTGAGRRPCRRDRTPGRRPCRPGTPRPRRPTCSARTPRESLTGARRPPARARRGRAAARTDAKPAPAPARRRRLA